MPNDETNEILLRIEKLLRSVLRAAFAETITNINADSSLRAIYEMTGGTATVSEIARKTNVSTGKISGVWRAWEQTGLIVKEGKSYKKLIS
jgi:DNA-binding MarR family transcriptional regulator